ncbi:MAG: T9SS type A sorting domain-containing protein [Bacteroidales bacterium]|nr:T9SS type A sorting domain-containing protein [Bacteroidales bacterium]
MKDIITTFLAALITSGTIYAQTIPFNTTPDWQSNPNGHIATGLGLADINGDGWKDMIVANGNDIEIQHLVVYYNKGDGTFNADPDWQSEDIDYHGHLAVGDIDLDGWPDVAVSVYIGHSGFGEPGKVKVYYNQEGDLESTPSFVSCNFYTFSCALGDADGDGDPDLATTGGEPYGSLYDKGKIFINNNGFFSQCPEWETSNAFGSLDVDFADMDNNGFLDVVFSSEETPNYIYLADNTGNISPTAAWQSGEPSNYINSLDIGFTSGNSTPGIVMTGNSQLGGDGKVRHYTFESGIPATSTASWTSNPFGYGSGILLAEINNDGFPDLIYGGWWLPVKIALGNASGFETTTSYTSSTSSVVEAIQMADLNKDGIQVKTQTIGINQSVSVVYLDDQLVENILDVRINGMSVKSSFFTCLPNKNWISFKDNLKQGDVVTVDYEYSESPDMVITNWDSGKGNYIFYNSPVVSAEPVAQPQKIRELSLSPNPARNTVNLEYSLGNEGTVFFRLINTGGQNVRETGPAVKPAGKHIEILQTSGLEKGTYILEFNVDKTVSRHKLMIR